MAQFSSSSTTVNVLLIGASAIVVIAGLQAAGEIILPILFAGFLSIICEPAVRGLVFVRVPRVLAVFLVVLLATGALIGGTALLGDSVARFTETFPAYQEPFLDMVQQVIDKLTKLGVPPPANAADLVDPSALVGLVGQTVGAVLTVLSRLIVIVITTAFILFESVELGDKLDVAFAKRPAIVRSLSTGAGTVQRYLAIKTASSLATGLLVGTLNYAIGLEFYVLWGVLAFLLNYIPSVGSIVAAVPPVVLALITLGPGWALGVGLGYVAVNLAIGNFIEPRILGRRLGLSPLVVILSLFFWGWVWGPAGMLLSVPMTVVVKLLLELNEDTRWLAILLGPASETEAVTGDVRPTEPLADGDES
jgi:AI-2 transport protein TqsA